METGILVRSLLVLSILCVISITAFIFRKVKERRNYKIPHNHLEQFCTKHELTLNETTGELKVKRES